MSQWVIINLPVYIHYWQITLSVLWFFLRIIFQSSIHLNLRKTTSHWEFIPVFFLKVLISKWKFRLHSIYKKMKISSFSKRHLFYARKYYFSSLFKYFEFVNHMEPSHPVGSNFSKKQTLMCTWLMHFPMAQDTTNSGTILKGN